MKIDIILDPTHTTEEFSELGIIAENLGFNAVLTANYPSAIDPFINFSILAKATQNIRMGPVAISPFETHPLKLSNLLYGLNQLSNGRAKIIVGGGGGTVQGVKECVEFLTGLSADQAISFNKNIFQIAGPKPQWIDQPTRPQIYVAATKPQMLSMSAKVADGLMMSDVTLARIDECMAIIDESLKNNGRDRNTFAISNLFSWHVKPDREEALKEARAKLFVRGMLENWYISTFLNPEESQIVENNFHAFAHAYAHNTDVIEGVPDAIIEKLLNHLTFTGDLSDVDRFVEEMVQFKNAGLDEFAIRLYKNPEQSMEVIAERVMPHL